jgi:MYXO-CTERM domain-containing protein
VTTEGDGATPLAGAAALATLLTLLVARRRG